MICNKCNDEVIVLDVCSGGVLQEVWDLARGKECAAESPAGSRGRAAEGVKGTPMQL